MVLAFRQSAKRWQTFSKAAACSVVSGRLFIGSPFAMFQAGTDNIKLEWLFHARLPKGHHSSMHCKNGDVVHVRKSTRPEPRQQKMYSALGICFHPCETIKKTMNKSRAITAKKNGI
jgi:hypothetical protein